MYSWEITQTLQNVNYNIDSETYINICRTSPQIIDIKYDAYENKFEMRSNDNYYWKFNVYYENKGENIYD